MRPLDVPVKYRALYAKAMSGKSRRAAVRAHCLMCVGWVPEEVTKCTAPNCPLYPYRLTRPIEGLEGAPEAAHAAAP